MSPKPRVMNFKNEHLRSGRRGDLATPKGFASRELFSDYEQSKIKSKSRRKRKN